MTTETNTSYEDQLAIEQKKLDAELARLDAFAKRPLITPRQLEHLEFRKQAAKSMFERSKRMLNRAFGQD